MPVSTFGIPQEFLAQAKRAVILEEIGLTAQSLAREITARVSALQSETGAATSGSPRSGSPTSGSPGSDSPNSGSRTSGAPTSDTA